MRILQINNCHYRRGGADIVYLNTIELLNKYNHKAIPFSSKNEKNIDSAFENYFISEINYFGANFFKKIFLFIRFFFSVESKKKIEILIKKEKPEIAHIHLYKGDLTPSILLALKKYQIPTVITLHDLGFLCPHNLMLDGKMNICTKCVKGSAFNCVVNKCNRDNIILSTVSALEFKFHKTFFPFENYFNKIIAVSKFGQNIHNESGRFKKPIAHLYNFYPQLTETIPDHSKGNYFLFFGRLSNEKGLNTLIDAWIKKDRNSILKIVGTGELYDDIFKKVRSNTTIELVGFKSGEELNRIIAKSSFVIVPSECYENNPLTIIEAYANGKPVIGSNVGGIPEIIEDGKTGFLFKMKDVDSLSEKIHLAENTTDKEYKSLSVNARKFSENNFDEESHYTKLMGIYKETIENGNRKKLQS